MNTLIGLIILILDIVAIISVLNQPDTRFSGPS